MRIINPQFTEPKSLVWVRSKEGQENKFEVNEDASKWLKASERKNTPVNLLMVFGKARSGKSTFLNLLNGDRQAMEAKDGYESFTRGTHLCTNLLRHGTESKPKMFLALVDNEGSGQQSETYDTMLMLPSLVMAKAIVFVIAGAPQITDILNGLMKMDTIRNRMKLGGSGVLGHLHIMCRLPDANTFSGHGELQSWIMDDKTEETSVDREHNKMRKQLREAFSSVTCWVTNNDQMIADKAHLKTGLKLDHFNKSYHDFFEEFKRKLAEQCAEECQDEGIPKKKEIGFYSQAMEMMVKHLNENGDKSFPLDFLDQLQKEVINEYCDELWKLMDKELYDFWAKWNQGDLPATEIAAVEEVTIAVGAMNDKFKAKAKIEKYKVELVKEAQKNFDDLQELLVAKVSLGYKKLQEEQKELINKHCDKLLKKELDENKFVLDLVARWKQGDLPATENAAVEEVATAVGAVNDNFNTKARIKKYKVELVKEAQTKFGDRQKLLVSKVSLAYKKAQEEQLEKELKDFLDEQGCKFLKKACLENKIVSKKQFMAVRDFPDTKEALYKGLSETEVKTANDAVYQSADFEAKTKVLKRRQQEFNGILGEVEHAKAQLSKLTKKKLDESDSKLREYINSVRKKVMTQLKINLPSLGDSKEELLVTMESLRKDIGGFTEILQSNKEIPDSELASYFGLTDGLLLKRHGRVDKRGNLFAYENCRLTKTSAALQTDRKYFISQAARDCLSTTASEGGRSLGVEAKISGAAFIGGGIGAFSVSAGIAKSSLTEKTLKGMSSSQTTKLHSMQSEFIPMADLKLDRNKIRFKPAVVTELKKLENMTKQDRDDAIWKFIEQYGSHVCIGATLGGYYIENSTASSKKGKVGEDLETVLADSFDMNAGASGTVIGLGGMVKSGVESKASQHSVEARADSGTVEIRDTKVTFSRTVKGGDALVAKSLWKQSLIYNANYSVIDRKFGDIVGVWELLPQDLKDLKSIEKQFEVVWMNKALRPNKVYIENVDALTTEVRNDFYEMVKSDLVTRATKDLWRDRHEKEIVEKKAKACLREKLEDSHWDVETAVGDCRNAANQELNAAHQRKQNELDRRDKNQKVVFLEVHFKIKDVKWKRHEMRYFNLMHAVAEKRDPRFRNYEWPVGGTISIVRGDDISTWGVIDPNNPPSIGYSNNRHPGNSNAPQTWHWTIRCVATKGSLLNANFGANDINNAINNGSPMNFFHIYDVQGC